MGTALSHVTELSSIYTTSSGQLVSRGVLELELN